jgi:di/tricarboxylate transporter
MLGELLGISLHAFGLIVLILFMVGLFITERLPVDVTAMGVLLILMVGGYVTPQEAFQGFSSPVVVVMVSTLFVASALKATGVSDAMARWIRGYAGGNERVAIAVIMLVGAFLSAFMNNISAAALVMPAVAVLSHETEIPPSRLYLPLAFAVTLGGMLTLIGTPPNIVASEIARQSGVASLSFFSFTPYGLVALAAGIIFMVTIGVNLLPVRKTQRLTRRITDLRSLYRLQDRLFSVRVPEGSLVDGKSLGDLRFGSLVSGVVVTIIRTGRKLLSPKATEKLHTRDVVLVRGNPERFSEVVALKGLAFGRVPEAVLGKLAQSAEIVRYSIREVHLDTRMISLRELLRTSGVVPLSVERGSTDHAWEAHPPSWFLDSLIHKGDQVLGAIVGKFSEDSPKVDVDLEVLEHGEHILAEHLHAMTVQPEGWSGAPLHRLSHETKLGILGRIVNGTDIEWLDVPVIHPGGEVTGALLSADHVIREGEVYLVSGPLEEAQRKAALGSLVLEGEAATDELESADVGIVELVLTPRSEFIGKTLADLHFREKFDCQVLALWRDGKAQMSLSSSLPLMYGDALLVQGARTSLSVLAKEPDFLLLSEHRQTPRLSIKSIFALIALFMLMFTPLVTGMAVHEAAFISACVCVLTGAITMEQVYREIDWRVVFLLALIIPLGHAVGHLASGQAAAQALADVANATPEVLLLLAFLCAGSVLSQVIDSSIAVIFLGPIAVGLGKYTGGNELSLLMAVALGSSLAFMLPTSCRSNMIVTGAGGYRVSDFLRVGIPFTIVVGLALLGALTFLSH